MKTILYNPIFINPQAYYVFPRLTRYLQPDNESTAEPANYIGTIEVKVIAYGDTTLKRTYTNTDSIDLSEFKNTWIRISLFTKVGSCVLGEWKIGNQDENYVKFEPVITSNVEYVRLDFYLNNYQKRINIGDYIPKDAYLRANLYLKNNVDELTVFTFNGVNIGYKRSSVDDTAFNINQIYNYDSPQEVNITVDEYIRYEDIVQPYPVVFQIKDRNTNQIYSWGDKIKVGSSIQLTQGENPNLLNGLYSIRSYEYEGKRIVIIN